MSRSSNHQRNRFSQNNLGTSLIGALAGCCAAQAVAAEQATDFHSANFAGSQLREEFEFSIPETSDQPSTRPLYLYSGPIQRGPGGVIGVVQGRFFETNGPVSFSVQAWLPHETQPGARRYSVDHIEGGLTLDLLPYAKMRLGSFDALGDREEFVAIQQYSYFEFNPPAQQMMLERLVAVGQSDAMTRHLLPRGAGAFSELGVQVFDRMRSGEWENSYAFMLGNDGQLSDLDAAPEPELTGYWSSTWRFGDDTAPNDGLKLFGWGQWGDREVSAAGEGFTFQSRWGLGTGLRRGKLRSSLEYIGVAGLSLAPGADGNNTSLPGAGAAWGWSCDFAYQVHPLCELALRFDQVFRDFNAVGGRLDTLTFGTQVLLGQDLRALLNYGLHWPEGMGGRTGAEHLVAAQLAFSF